MDQSLLAFSRIVTDLLNDEKAHPMAKHLPTDDLFDTLDLDLSQDPIGDEKLHESLKELVFRAPRTATKTFFNQLFGGRHDKAILGELLTVLLNNSMYTYKAAGPMVGTEKVIIRKICDMIGWGETSGGAFAAGGSMTNFMGMLMGRDAHNRDIIQTGNQGQLTVYTSEISHYSIPKNAAFCGIGRQNVRMIKTDDKGRMNPSDLENHILADKAAGHAPVLVNLTAGTTVLGSFDPIDEISQVCKKHNIWLHVDGAYCGAVLFSKKYKHLIKGVEKVDSFSFNAHKMLTTPLSCSLILVKERSNLLHSFSNEASYLYQTDADDFNHGKTSLQCGRRNDALKFWTLWKSVGTSGLEHMVDHQFKLADTAREYVRNHPDYELYSFEESISVCFNYKGYSAREICNRLYEKSTLSVGYGSFGSDEFIRLVTINTQNDIVDIHSFFRILEEFVAEHF